MTTFEDSDSTIHALSFGTVAGGTGRWVAGGTGSVRCVWHGPWGGGVLDFRRPERKMIYADELYEED